MSSENSSSILPPVPVQDQTKDLLRVPTKDHPTTKHSSPISSTECPSDLELRRLVWSKEYRSLLNSTNRIRVSKAPLNSDSNNLIPLKTVSNGIFDPAILTPPRRQPVLDGQSVQPILKSTDDDSSPLESSIEEEPGALSVLETSMESNHSCDESNLKMPVSEDAKSTYSSNDVEGLVDVPEDSVNDDSGSSASSAKRVKSYLVFAILIFIVVLAYTNICMGLIYWKQCNMDTTALILTGICGLVGVFPRVITTIFSRFFKRRYKFTVLTCAAYSLGGPMVALEVANVMGHKDFSICPVFFTYVLFMNRSIAGILIVLILIKLDGLFSCCRPKFPTLTRIRSFEGI